MPELTGAVAGTRCATVAARLNAENGNFLVDQSTEGVRGFESLTSVLHCRYSEGRRKCEGDMKGCDDGRRAIVVDCVELRDRQFGGGGKLSGEDFTLPGAGVDVPSLNQELQSEK